MKIIKKFFALLCAFVLTTTSCSSQKKTFKNIELLPAKSLLQVLKWKLFSDKTPWPKWIKTKQFKVPSKRVTGDKLSYNVINHATVLIQWKGLNILTDPIYSERTSPVSWAGPKRVRKPGVAFEDLPPIDIVLISHNHYDHLDTETLKSLEKRDSPVVYAGLENGKLLSSIGIKNIVEMDWWQEKAIGDLSVTFVPAQHWCARGIFDRNDTLWGGYVITSKEGKKIYFAGDTGYGKFFKMIREKVGPMDLSFIPIGAYEPRWFMKDQHVNPEEAIKAHFDLESKHSVGIHFETFQLTNEGFDEPRKALNEQWANQKTETSFIAPEFGKTIEVDSF